MNWNNIWQTIKNYFTNNAGNIARFFLVLFFGFFICKIVIKLTRKILSNSRIEKITQKFILSVLRVIIWVVYIMTLLSILGVDLTGIMAAFTAGAVAVGLALENSLSNLAGGIILISSKMFKSGDYIAVGGVEGTVTNIGLLESVIVTTDNKTIHIPNSTIINSSLTNYSTMPTRKIVFNFDVDYASNVTKVKEIINNVFVSNGKILLDPKPSCNLKALNDSSINIVASCWVDNEDYWDVYYYVMDKVFDEFKKNNINIPYNQLEVRLRQDEVVMPTYNEPLPQRVEKVRQEKIEGDFIDQLIIKQQRKSKANRAKRIKSKANKK